MGCIPSYIKNAMLVVVCYSHLTWKLEFDRFRTTLLTLHKNAMLVVVHI